MKSILTIAAVLIGLTSASAQKIKEAEVPSLVKESVKKKFPNAQAKEWEKENDHFEVELVENKEKFTAVFDANGRHQETEKEIKLSEVPKAAIDYIAAQKTGKKAKEASKITDAMGKISYEVEAGEWAYYFNDKGDFVSKEKETEKDDKD